MKSPFLYFCILPLSAASSAYFQLRNILRHSRVYGRTVEQLESRGFIPLFRHN